LETLAPTQDGAGLTIDEVDRLTGFSEWEDTENSVGINNRGDSFQYNNVN